MLKLIQRNDRTSEMNMLHNEALSEGLETENPA